MHKEARPIEPETNEPIYVNRKRAAEEISCCERTIANLEARGLLVPAIRVGRLVRYRLSDIQALGK